MTSLYKILKSAKLGEGAAQDFHTAIMAQKMPFAKRSGAEHEYTGAVPVTFTADGTPLLDYLISGNAVQSGTPTPDSPIIPQGTGERTGNLVNFPVYRRDKGFDNSRIHSTYLPENTYTLSCEILIHEGSGFGSAGAIYMTVNGTKRYIIGGTGAIDAFQRASITYTGEITEVGFIGYNYNPSAPNSYVIIKNTQINLGSTALPYEPYGYKIPISSAGQTTPIYLGEAETTRKIKKLVLTGEETITKAASNPVFTMQLGGSITPLSENTVTTLSTHYQAQSNTTGTGNVGDMKVCIRRGYDTMYIGDARYDNITDFKSYLAAQYANGTPVTVWYVLATPVTGIVNEPLMRIGDYADTVSHAQAGVSIPTVNGSTTLDVETAVKPSEIYIKYKS